MVNGVCFIEEVPFRGCNCTDAAGREFAYKDVIKMLGENDILVNRAEVVTTAFKDGDVEMDAAVMNGKDLALGGVGAVGTPSYNSCKLKLGCI